MGSFGGEFGASCCNQWGLCDAALRKLLWAGLVTIVTSIIYASFKYKMYGNEISTKITHNNVYIVIEKNYLM